MKRVENVQELDTKIAGIVRSNTRSSDLVARYGGDEFMVLLTSNTAKREGRNRTVLAQTVGTGGRRVCEQLEPLISGANEG